MFKSLTSELYNFDFNNKKFEIYNKNLIKELLGKSGNQTAVNGGGSVWIKIVKRRKTNKQEAGERYNPKYSELFNLMQRHIEITKNLEESYNTETLINNLKRFKSDFKFRKEIFKKTNKENSFKKNIPFEYLYIFLSIYIAFNYTYFEKNELEKFEPINFKDKDDYIKKFKKIINSDEIINNLTCFCYTQYFWFDYHLSESSHSKIHETIKEISISISKINTNQKKSQQRDPENQIHFDAKETSMGNLLEIKKQFIIPSYQREFSWTKEQIITFLIDLFNIYEHGEDIEKYFLGSIVLISKGDFYEVVDGQQRLTTILIAFSVLKELYSSNDLKEVVQDPYLTYKINVGSKMKEKNKLQLNKNNKDFFEKYITSSRSNEARKNWQVNDGSNKLIQSAFNIIKKEIEENHDQKINYDSYITSILNLLKDKISVVQIKVDNKKTSNTIFETLNDRGKVLETHENIKNHIYGRSFKNVNDIEMTWDRMVRMYSKKFPKYLLSAYRSKYGEKYRELSKKIFFTHFKANKEISNDYYKFILELESELSIYESIIKPNEDNWDAKSYKNLKILEAFDSEGVYLILLSSKIMNFEFNKILNLVVKLVFRNKFAKELPYGINEMCSRVSKRIRESKITIQDIEKEFNRIVCVSDDKIKINFLEEEIAAKGNFAKKILIILNQYGADKKNPIDWNKLTVEHIYAKSSPEIFKKQIEKIESEYFEKYKKNMKYNINHIYNLTLLPKLPIDRNSRAGNKDFNEKKVFYKNEKYIITNEKISTFDNWNLDNLEIYKEYLWSLAEKVFKLK